LPLVSEWLKTVVRVKVKLLNGIKLSFPLKLSISAFQKLVKPHSVNWLHFLLKDLSNWIAAVLEELDQKHDFLLSHFGLEQLPVQIIQILVFLCIFITKELNLRAFTFFLVLFFLLASLIQRIKCFLLVSDFDFKLQFGHSAVQNFYLVGKRPCLILELLFDQVVAVVLLLENLAVHFLYLFQKRLVLIFCHLTDQRLEGFVAELQPLFQTLCLLEFLKVSFLRGIFRL
jgi:hypothetical protein